MIPPEVREALRAVLPGANLDGAEPLGEGWAQAAYRLRAPDGDRVLRFPRLTRYAGPERPGLLDMALADLAREVRLLPALVEWGLSVPRDMRGLLDGDGRTIGSLHRPVEGRPLSRGDLRQREQADRLARELGEFFTRLHAFPRERAIACGMKDIDLWDDQYSDLIEFCRPLLGARSRQWVDGVAAQFRAAGGMVGAPRVPIHGDISGDHILLGPDGALAGVIDFGDAMVADPALDFAGLLNNFSWTFMERVLDHYEGEVDADLRRRARWYIDVAPLFQVRYGDLVRGGQERIDGLRRIAAQAAAATRLQRYTRGPN